MRNARSDIQRSAIDPAGARAPGTDGIWTFVFIDMIVFLLIFFVYMTDRLSNFASYKASQAALDPLFGFANTLILLTSSWMVVEAIHAARNHEPRKVKWWLYGAIALGLAFCVNKVVEYHLKFTHGISFVAGPFYTFYFFITIAHFLHVIAGLLFIRVFAQSSDKCTTSEQYTVGLENVGLFWHYVDALWIFIFPLLYLV